MGTLFAFVLFACLAGAIAVLSTDEVLVLNEENFDQELQFHDAVLVKFYAPWCPHSQALAPEWDKAAQQLASSPIRLAKVDGTENEELARKYEIGQYPTLKYFRGGRMADYKGGRTAPEIVAWALRKFEPKVHVLNTEDSLIQFQEKHEVFSLGVFSSLDSEAAQGYQILAAEDEAHVYAITTDAALKAKLFFPRKIGDREFVIVFKPFDEMRVDLPLPAAGAGTGTASFDFQKVSDFVKFQSTPPVQEFSPATMRRISQSPIKYHVLFFTDKALPHHDEALRVYGQVSMEYRNKLLFVNVPSAETKALSFFKIDASNLPAMVAADFSDKIKGMRQFPYTGGLDKADISTFLQSVLDGEASPEPSATTSGSRNPAKAQGEAVAPQDTQGNVVVVRSASYEEIVLNSDKHVLLEFYAPWCGHCKNLAPIYEELGARLKARSDVTIAKIDYTANEVAVAGAEIAGFPTVLLFKRGQKDRPVVYRGARELMAFTEFIEAQTGAENSIRREL